MPTLPTIILLVEDDPLMADLYEATLGMGGYQVRKLFSGEEVMSDARAVRPVLIVLDLMMPRISGMDVLAKLKSDAATRDIPVVISSNLLDPAIAEKALEAGAARYALKSEYRPKEFVELVKEVIKEDAARKKQKKA